jgi:NTE family protein
MELIRPYVGATIETLMRPFAAVATDLRTGEEVVLRQGRVVDAIRASIAIPGVFTPQRLGGRLLGDGGLVDPVPVHVARELGSDFVIAISVLPPLGQAPVARIRRSVPKPLFVRLLAGAGARRAAARAALRRKAAARTREEALGLIEVILEATRIVERRIAAARLREEPPDFLIEIPLSRVGIFDFQLTSELVEAGRIAGRGALPALERALKRSAPSIWARWRRERRVKGS